MNIHITPRTIYLTRHGESLHNVVGKIGGNSDLSPTGQRYASLLSEYINSQNISGETRLLQYQVTWVLDFPKLHFFTLYLNI